MGVIPEGRTFDAMRTAKSKSLGELEKRGLACYGLRFNRDFKSPVDPGGKGLIRNKTGNITTQLVRDLESYGGMPCKGKY